jgi:pantoate--beta-alanine ligase
MTTTVVESISELRRRLQNFRETGLVPTMGALHAGHAKLIETACSQCDCVVVSIFVNPLQFDRKDDLDRYPRTLDSDVELCGKLGVDLIFAPSALEMYPKPPLCTVEVGRIADHLCGPFRPGHFRGVATVVMKLLQIVQPHRAYFGEKDAQQLAVIRRVVADLNVPTAIVEVPTVREADGLALSSRNRLLSGAQRASATVLYEALREAASLIAAGQRDPVVIKRTATNRIGSTPGVRLEYFDTVDPDEMQPVSRIDGPVRVAGAIWVGSTRLIDNMLCVPPEHGLQKVRHSRN